MPRPITLIICAFVLLCSTALPGAKHDSWVEVRSPNFIVVSNAGEKQARKTAIHFEQIRAVFRNSLEVAKAHTSPVITILAVKDENSMKALLPEYWAKGHMHPAGIFWGDMGQFFAAVQLDSQGADPYITIYHEYYHSLTMPYYPNLPLWLAEGLAEFYGNTQVTDTEAGLGRPSPELISELKQEKLIPLETLFKVDHNSPYYNEEHKSSIFYAESWALTHYLMAADKASHMPMLVAYLHQLGIGATQEEAAAKAFGDLKVLQATLTRYVENYEFYYLKDPPPPAIPASDFHARDLSDAEAEVYRGGFQAMRGKTAEAKQMLQEALKIDPKLSLGYLYLGFAELRDGQHAEALADFTRSIDLNPKNSLAFYLRAYLSMRQEGKVGNDEQVEKDLRAAIAISPEFAPPYGLLAVCLAIRGESMPEALAFAQKGVALEPGNSGYQFDLAQVLAQMNRYDEARTAALRARANSKDPGTKQQADQFLAYLQQSQATRADNSVRMSPAASDSTPADLPKAKPAELESSSDAADSADLQEVTGLVTNVSCMNGLKFEITTDSGPVTLHSKPGSNLRFTFSARPTGQFNPCTDLKGQHVTVKYQPDTPKANIGAVESVLILSGSVSPAANKTGSANPQGARRLQAPAKPDDPSTVSVEGDVKEVTCTGNEMTLILDAGGTPFTLHARDATRVPYEQDVAFGAGNFQACSQLKDRHAKITFTVVVRKNYAGEIQGVEIIK